MKKSKIDRTNNSEGILLHCSALAWLVIFKFMKPQPFAFKTFKMKRPLPLRHNLAPSGIAASKTSLCKNIHDKLQWKETTHNLSLIFRFKNQIGPQITCSCLIWSYIIHCSHFTLFATIPPSVLLTWIPDLPVTSSPPLRSAPITTSGETLHRSLCSFSRIWPLAHDR